MVPGKRSLISRSSNSCCHGRVIMSRITRSMSAAWWHPCPLQRLSEGVEAFAQVVRCGRRAAQQQRLFDLVALTAIFQPDSASCTALANSLVIGSGSLREARKASISFFGRGRQQAQAFLRTGLPGSPAGLLPIRHQRSRSSSSLCRRLAARIQPNCSATGGTGSAGHTAAVISRGLVQRRTALQPLSDSSKAVSWLVGISDTPGQYARASRRSSLRRALLRVFSRPRPAAPCCGWRWWR